MAPQSEEHENGAANKNHSGTTTNQTTAADEPKGAEPAAVIWTLSRWHQNLEREPARDEIGPSDITT
jgi:hypothetical protein